MLDMLDRLGATLFKHAIAKTKWYCCLAIAIITWNIIICVWLEHSLVYIAYSVLAITWMLWYWDTLIVLSSARFYKNNGMEKLVTYEESRLVNPVGIIFTITTLIICIYLIRIEYL